MGHDGVVRLTEMRLPADSEGQPCQLPIGVRLGNRAISPTETSKKEFYSPLQNNFGVLLIPTVWPI